MRGEMNRKKGGICFTLVSFQGRKTLKASRKDIFTVIAQDGSCNSKV